MKLLSTLLFVAIAGTGFAQNQKLLFKYSRHKHAIYLPGDQISFRIKGSDDKVTWQLADITDSMIASVYDTISPSAISHIYIDEKTKIFFPFRYKMAGTLVAAGVGYFLIDWVNSREIDKSTVLVSSSLVAAGVAYHFLVKKYIRLTHRRKLVILR